MASRPGRFIRLMGHRNGLDILEKKKKVSCPPELRKASSLCIGSSVTRQLIHSSLFRRMTFGAFTWLKVRFGVVDCGAVQSSRWE